MARPGTANTTFLGQVDSTNRYVRERFGRLADRHAVVADQQTSGRGRLSRSWHSPLGNLYLTLALRSDSEIPCGFPNLTQYMALILSGTLETYGVQATIKWPNDLQVGGRKIAGILAEAVLENGRLAGIALGCGVNLNMSRNETAVIEQPATALNLETGDVIQRDNFLQRLLRSFFEEYDEFLSAGFQMIRGAFCQKCPFLGTEISIVSVNSHVVGLARDITTDGALLIETQNGTSVEITLGDMQC